LLSALPYASNPRKDCHREDAGLDFAEQTLRVEFDTLSQVLPNPLKLYSLEGSASQGCRKS